MRNPYRLGRGIVGVLLLILVAEACAAARTGRGSVWQRSGSCPATRVDNHVY
ncbi:MAG: hypothetical protein N3A68_03820 [Bacteroidia bacterium]|jgi:hypothetical protein|nr:hypothetical protein [Bacteroidia bacterium]GIV22543.1 MAG: hypothetical protein KatS3mg025_0202 [Bacteroidia bacterium]